MHLFFYTRMNALGDSYILWNKERHFDFKDFRGQVGAFIVCLRGLLTCMLNYTLTDLLYILDSRMLELMSLWPLPVKLRQQHSERSTEIVSAACWPFWIVGCFVLPSYLYGWETVMSFCSLTLLFCESTSFSLWMDCHVLQSIEISLIILLAFCKKRNTIWFNASVN